MIASPCKNCPRKNLPKDKCINDCQVLNAVQAKASSDETLNEGCGIDYTEEYGFNIPLSLPSNTFISSLYSTSI